MTDCYLLLHMLFVLSSTCDKDWCLKKNRNVGVGEGVSAGSANSTAASSGDSGGGGGGGGGRKGKKRRRAKTDSALESASLIQIH